LKLEKVFTVHVRIDKTIELKQEAGNSVVMIAFGGHVTGTYFQGEVLEGGVDTQIIGQHGDRHNLSARYMLQGKDYTGNACKIYIENNGEIHKNDQNYLFRTYPKLITDSKALSFLNTELLLGEGTPTDIGVDINIYRWV